MKHPKNFIKSDSGISSKLREITHLDYKSGKIGWLNLIYTCHPMCVCEFSYALFRTSAQITVALEIGHIIQKKNTVFKNVIYPFKTYWLRHAPSGLTINNCTFCPHCIYVFCVYLRTNSDLRHLQHKLIGFYNWDETCLQRGTDWVLK